MVLIGKNNNIYFILQLFLNGDLVADGPGNGYLSQDWTGKAGIGKLYLYVYIYKYVSVL